MNANEVDELCLTIFKQRYEEGLGLKALEAYQREES